MISLALCQPEKSHFLHSLKQSVVRADAAAYLVTCLPGLTPVIGSRDRYTPCIRHHLFLLWAGMQLAIVDMTASAWEIRNAASLVYAALIMRMLGFRNLRQVNAAVICIMHIFIIKRV